MTNRVLAATALASSLVLLASVAGATPAPTGLNQGLNISPDGIQLIRSGGGRGGGGGGGHSAGGPHPSAGANLGARFGGGDAGGGRFAGNGGDHVGAHVSGPRGGNKSGRSANRGGKPGGGSKGRVAGNDWKGDWKGHGRDHHGKNFRRFYGPDIFVGTYGYDDCGWLARKARLTGDPYWWRRYQECLYG